MGKIIRNGIEFSSTVDTANNISYDNSLSGLEATTTQKAIDEVAESLEGYPKIYRYEGLIMNSSHSTFEAHGCATITVFANGLVKIEYNALVTTASSVPDNFIYGVNRDVLTPLIGRAIIPERGGIVSFYTSSGVKMGENGHGGLHNVDAQFWTLARVYTTTGDVGTWEDARFSLGCSFSGICYGRLS